MLHSLALSNGEDFIIRAGAIAAAIVAVVMAVKILTKGIVKQLTKAIHSELGYKVDQINENTLELKPNGGSTVADAVRRLEAVQGELLIEQRYQRAEITRNREAVESTKASVVEHLSDHRRLPPLS